MDSIQTYKFIQESLKFKRNQEILTLSRYYLFSCIFDLPQKDVLLFYPNSKTFSVVGLLHFSISEIQKNEIDLNSKLNQRRALNEVFSFFIKDNAHVNLLNLLDNIQANEASVANKIQELANTYNLETNTLSNLLQIETEQLLRIFVFTEEPDQLFAEFLNNMSIIEKANINNNNIKFFLCNFISNYLEVVNGGEFYKLNNQITIAGIYSGVSVDILKDKLNFYRSILNSKEYVSKRVDYLVKLNGISKSKFKDLMTILSEFNKRDLDFLVSFSRLIYTPTQNKDDIAPYKFELITDSNIAYKSLDELRAKNILVEEITQFFNLTLKYQINFFEYYQEYNFTFLHFVLENASMLIILFFTYEGDVDVEVHLENKDRIISRIENKTKFIVDTLSDFIAVPLNFEIYNLNRLQTLLKKVVELRTIVSTPQDSDGVILNILNTSLKYNIITEFDARLINLKGIDSLEIKEELLEVNTKVVNAYKAIIGGIYGVSKGYSLLNVARNSLASDQDINTAIEVKLLLENLRLVGLSNVFLAEDKYFFVFSEEVLKEYLNTH